MKNNKSLIIFLLFWFCLFLPKLSAELSVPFTEIGPVISLDFKDADLKDILKVFSIQSGLNFIASEVVQDRKITLYLDNVPLDKAMDKLFEANNLSYELDQDAKIFIVKEWGKLEAETITKVFFLKHATVSSSALRDEINTEMEREGSDTTGGGKEGKGAGITEAIKEILSEYGSVIEDSRTNSLIITDTPRNMQRITQVIASLDVSVPQVLLEVEILDVNKNVIDDMGIQWSNPLAALTVTGSRLTGFPFGGSGTSGFAQTLSPSDSTAFGGPGDVTWSINPWNATHFGPSILTVLGQTIDLDFLRTHTDTKYLARPRILVLNNETAEIKVMMDEAINLTTTQSAAGELSAQTTDVPQREKTGVSLRVTPQVNMETGEIAMFVVPSVREASSSAVFSNVKDIEERSAKTIVRVKDNETVVIGGLIRTAKSETRTKIPILGDIPILGALFRHKYKEKDQERELLVFITPHIVKEDRTEMAQARRSIIPEREQDVAGRMSRELAIGTALNQVEKKRYK